MVLMMKCTTHFAHISLRRVWSFSNAFPDLNFYAGVSGRSQESRFWRLNPPPCAVTVGVNRSFTLFFAGVKLDPNQSTVAPEGNPDAHTCHSTSQLYHPPGP